MKKFDYCIGNPPYQETTSSDSTRMPPVYHQFLDAAYSVASKVEMIHPARFLFDTGFTPHEWNMKMLNDEHFKVQHYEPDCTKVFANTDIKGGIAITYHDENQNFGAIGTFVKYAELSEILKKVLKVSPDNITSIIFPALNYKLSDIAIREHPNTVGRLRTNAFTSLAELFYETQPQDNNEYTKFLGVYGSKRTYRYIKRQYLKDTNHILDNYSIILAVVNGSGDFGEELSKIDISEPNMAYSQSFIAIGKCNTLSEAQSVEKYVKTKMCRALLGIAKSTQQCSALAWRFVPIQNFTDTSDIDWSKSIHEIDLQLYKKYGLSKEEIDFIETNVKEMD